MSAHALPAASARAPVRRPRLAALAGAALALAGLAPACPAATPRPDEVVTRAAALATGGDFEGARELYRSLADGGHFAPEVFFQLANAEYRLGDVAASALNYRRALALDPAHRESAQNLRFLRREAGFSDLETSPSAAFAGILSRDTWLVLLVAGGWTAAVSFGAMLGLRNPNTPALAAVAFAGVVAASIAGTGLVLGARSVVPPGDRAVVMSDGAAALTSPGTGAAPVIQLPPGSEVEVLAERGPWFYASAASGSRGWLHRDQVTPLWPFPEGVLR